MNFTKKDLIYLSFFLILLFKNSPEKMSNTDIKKIIQTEYKIDVDAIRNLSKLANDLTSNGKLTVPGGLEIQGEVTMKKGLKITGSLKGQGTNCLDLVGGLHVKNGTVAINRSDAYQALSVNGVSHFNKIVNMTNAELRIKNGKNGTTHFNYQNRGLNYIRGTNLNIDTSNTNISRGMVNMTNAELRIRNGKNGTTHFNYLNRGTNYIRGGNLNIDTSNTNIKNIKKSWYWKAGRYQSAPNPLYYMDRQYNHCPKGQFMSGIRWLRSGSKIQTSLLCSKLM